MIAATHIITYYMPRDTTPGVSSFERAISAFVGYTAGAVVVLPFDRVKSLLQVS